MLINNWITENYPTINRALEDTLKNNPKIINGISFRKNCSQAHFIYNENSEYLEEEILLSFDLETFPIILME